MSKIYSDNTINYADNYICNKKSTIINDKSSIQASTTDNTDTIKNSKTNTDSIQISETNENLINTKKSKDALDYTLKDYSDNEKSQMVIALSTLNYYMECHGEETPLSTNCLEHSFSFTNYANKLVEYTKQVQETSPGFLPSNFLDFCEEYQKNLKNLGCN
ncbi:hypothetical protein [Clostridium oryzae]|uniref:Uncharacterized protein n=1 Tax=Clostridium oryzae TaxID=1450648 RepID=A0A1V4ITM6_9CLOT|nr:hypothetical protein [Clostridium oryzae]OPJ63388.1 hypothetical protein CLORY_11700 [Clostridium oryzae]